MAHVDIAALVAELDGSVVASTSRDADPRVYLVDSGVRRWILTPELFEKLGFTWADIRPIDPSTLGRIPTGTPIDGNLTYEIRYQASRRYLLGHGVEIGGGLSPQKLPPGATSELYDKRSSEELAEYFQASPLRHQVTYALAELPKRFPNGADFLIAHHVLEHSADPIRSLMQWHGYVKDGGMIVIGVPDASHCSDAGRLIPPLEHVLFDYLLERDDDNFESREHIYSFLMGWCDLGIGRGIDKFELAKRAHDCAHAPRNDLHWHSFNRELLEGIVHAASLFGGCAADVKVAAAPDIAGRFNPEAEILYVYRIDRLAPGAGHRLPPYLVDALNRVQSKLTWALDSLRHVGTSAA